jgi:hypothetical protein
MIDQGSTRDFFKSDAYLDLVKRFGLNNFKLHFIRQGQFLRKDFICKGPEEAEGNIFIVRRNVFSRKINGFAEELRSFLLDCGYPACKIEMVFWQSFDNVTSIFCSACPT